jgi:hypothetical protein
MNKKIFVAAMIILTLASIGVANAQPTGKISRIGIVADVNSPQLEALRQGLRDMGYIEKQNLVIEYRYAEAKRDRVPELVAELLDLKIMSSFPWDRWLQSLPKSSRVSRLFSAPAVIRLKPESSPA